MEIKITIFLLTILCFIPSVSNASQIILESKGDVYKIGEELKVGVYLNTGNDNINAMDGAINFPTDVLKVEDIIDGDSSINFWIKRPSVSEGQIIYSGITPGGITGNKMFLFFVFFKALKETNGEISSSNTSTLKNDGSGTKINVKEGNYSFKINNLTSTVELTDNKFSYDKIPPESFLPVIGSDIDIYNGKLFLAFSTQDKESGIDHYEVKEGFFGNYVVAESPFLVSNQAFSKAFYVKALDKNGNERVEKIYDGYKNSIFIKLIICVIILFVFIYLVSRRKIRFFIKKNDKEKL